MKLLTLLMLLLPGFHAHAQNAVEPYPSHWWVGMKNKDIQIMLHGNNIGNATAVTTSYPGVTVRKINKVENKNYLFVDIAVGSGAKPGTIHFRIGGAQPSTLPFELKARRAGNGTRFARGVTSKDFIYLLMPDRFSNGDTSNDRIAGMKDQSLDRDSIFLRHGGDMQGVTDHLNYLQQLGVTTLWMTPVLENDMPDRTEHGYAFTNHYAIERRLGGAAAYSRLSDSLHARGMKLIQDAVYNHVGLYHFTVQDPPTKDWLHQWPAFTKPNYKDQTHFDPYAAAADKKQMTDGWFTNEMPDLNQGNPYVANYLIQHAIWCVEEFGVDGWRIDTYIYIDLPFMNRCNQALIDEYPHITMFGEAWVTGTANEAFFTRNRINTPFKSNLPGVTDFPVLFEGIQPALSQPTDGVNRLYQTLSNDFLYENPMNNVIFLDNHDMSRFVSQMGEDVAKLKIGLAWLLTARGIPQLYYGTEVLMKGISNPDGWVRLDFPGGWKNDRKNVFTRQGLTAEELDVLQYTTALANFRKTATAIGSGRLMQYVPADGVYVYFRYDRNQTVMTILNTGDVQRTLDVNRFTERTAGFSKGRDVVTSTTRSLQDPWTIPAKTAWVLELVNN